MVLHFSDLHLLWDEVEQQAIFDSLVSAVQHVREQGDGPIGLLAFTGDIFDSASVDASFASARFAELHEQIQGALGGTVPSVIVPGNHDRRRNGLFGPHRPELFRALQRRLGSDAWVHGCDTPFLSELVPNDYHHLPLWVVAYDSTYLPRGLVSAGGMLRQEDLLYVAAQIGDREPDWPVLFLLHHHLVPTPLTDLGAVDVARAPAIARFVVQHALPALVAHADREELTMTALGAGTALSTLHTLGRSVLALHGHKHYATARMLDGMSDKHGDVLLVSAGSAGQAQRFRGQNELDVARLWPSFNVILLDGDHVTVDTVSFAWKAEGGRRHSRRALVRARRNGSQWQVEPLHQVMLEDPGPKLLRNHARIELRPSERKAGRFDYVCERVLTKAPEVNVSYIEMVYGLTDALCNSEQLYKPSHLPTRLTLSLAQPTRYEVQGGVFRTLAEAQRTLGVGASPFSQLSLLNRYGSEEACLSVVGLGDSAQSAFGSITDLGTGLERPARLERGERPGEVQVSMVQCPPRTLLRIYWRCER